MTQLIRDSEYKSYFFKEKEKKRGKKVVRFERIVEKTAASRAFFSQLDYI